MTKVPIEREPPTNFDVTDDVYAARHAASRLMLLS
jgi:hypothetical protein